jgi:hypothetical protein
MRFETETECKKLVERCLVYLEEVEVATPNRCISFECVGLSMGLAIEGVVDGDLCTWYGTCIVSVHFF